MSSTSPKLNGTLAVPVPMACQICHQPKPRRSSVTLIPTPSARRLMMISTPKKARTMMTVAAVVARRAAVNPPGNLAGRWKPRVVRYRAATAYGQTLMAATTTRSISPPAQRAPIFWRWMAAKSSPLSTIVARLTAALGALWLLSTPIISTPVTHTCRPLT